MGKTAAETISVMDGIFKRMDPRLRGSVTFDNAPYSPGTPACVNPSIWRPGFAMPMPPGIGAVSKMPMDSSADGCREIGDIDAMSDAEAEEMALTANLTPHKCLAFKTPFQALAKEFGKDIKLRFAVKTLHVARNARGAEPSYQ